MTEQTTDTTAEQPTAPQDAEQPQNAPEAPQDAQETQEPQEHGKAAGEARKYRQRLRAAEAELQAANERVDTLQRAEVERLAQASGLPKAGALWAVGVTLEQVRDDHGNVSSDRVAEHVQRVRDELGIGAPNRQPDPGQQGTPADDQGDAWSDAFRMI